MKALKSSATVLVLVVCIIVAANTDVQAETIVYDADGQFLGTLLGVSFDRANVYIPSLSKIISISIFDGNIIDSSFYFQSTDCTGIAYSGPSVYYMIIKNGDTYYSGEDSAPTDVSLKSYLKPDGTCSIANTTREFIPLKGVSQPDISLPVSLPLNFEHEPTKPGTWK